MSQVPVKPHLCSDSRERIWVIWTEKREGKWKILGSYIEEGRV